MNQPSILHVVHSLHIGGLERVVVELAKSFQTRGYRTSICCLSEKGTLAAEAERGGVPVAALSKRDGIDPRTPFRLRGLMKAGQFHIVHTHNEAGLLYGTAGALLAGCRNIVHTEHGKEPGYRNDRTLQAVEGILLRRVREIVLVSEGLKTTVPPLKEARKQRIHTVANGIDTEPYSNCRYKIRTKISLQLKPDCRVIGHVARFIPLKNQMFLLSVFEQLRKKYRDLQLVMIGDGPVRRDLEAYCRRVGMIEDVHFLGARSDIPELLSIMDLFMLTSVTEGVSITLLEAMASGIPILASNVGGTPDIIEHGRTGFLLELGSPEAWVRVAGGLLDSPEECARISFAAKASVRRRFSLKAMTDSYEKIYQRLF